MQSAMLGFIVTEFLFDWWTERSPGDMTEWRALIVSNAMLGMVTARNSFSSHLRHSSQQLQRDIGRYLDLFSGLPSTNFFFLPSLLIGTQPTQSLADFFEALIGAILKSAERVSLPCCSKPLIFPLSMARSVTVDSKKFPKLDRNLCRAAPRFC
jgi:dsRNA-specific ribonuclease